MTDHRCPRNVVIADDTTGELVERRDWPLADGRVLRLRLARGRITERHETNEPPPIERETT